MGSKTHRTTCRANSSRSSNKLGLLKCYSGKPSTPSTEQWRSTVRSNLADMARNVNYYGGASPPVGHLYESPFASRFAIVHLNSDLVPPFPPLAQYTPDPPWYG